MAKNVGATAPRGRVVSRDPVHMYARGQILGDFLGGSGEASVQCRNRLLAGVRSQG